MNLMEILAQTGGSLQQARATIDPEAAIARLREYAERFADMYANGPRFGVGDIVRPYRDAPFSRHDYPHLVVFAQKPAQHEITDNSDISESTFKPWRDIRVLVMANNETAAPFWAESAFFELWSDA